MSRQFHQRAIVAIYLYDTYDGSPIKNAQFQELTGALVPQQKLFNKKDGYYTGINFPNHNYEFAIKADGYMDSYCVIQNIEDNTVAAMTNNNILVRVAMTPTVRVASQRKKDLILLKLLDENRQIIKQKKMLEYVGCKKNSDIIRVTKLATTGSNTISLNNVAKDQLVGNKLFVDSAKVIIDIVDYDKHTDQYILASKTSNEIAAGALITRCWQVQTDMQGLFPLLDCKLGDELYIITTTIEKTSEQDSGKNNETVKEFQNISIDSNILEFISKG